VDGTRYELGVHEDDEPEALAHSFSDAHELNAQYRDLLVRELTTRKHSALKDRPHARDAPSLIFSLPVTVNDIEYKLPIFKGDNLEATALRFCKEHKVDMQYSGIILEALINEYQKFTPEASEGQEDADEFIGSIKPEVSIIEAPLKPQGDTPHGDDIEDVVVVDLADKSTDVDEGGSAEAEGEAMDDGRLYSATWGGNPAGQEAEAQMEEQQEQQVEEEEHQDEVVAEEQPEEVAEEQEEEEQLVDPSRHADADEIFVVVEGTEQHTAQEDMPRETTACEAGGGQCESVQAEVSDSTEASAEAVEERVEEHESHAELIVDAAQDDASVLHGADGVPTLPPWLLSAIATGENAFAGLRDEKLQPLLEQLQPWYEQVQPWYEQVQPWVETLVSELATAALDATTVTITAMDATLPPLRQSLPLPLRDAIAPLVPLLPYLLLAAMLALGVMAGKALHRCACGKASSRNVAMQLVVDGTAFRCQNGGGKWHQAILTVEEQHELAFDAVQQKGAAAVRAKQQALAETRTVKREMGKLMAERAALKQQVLAEQTKKQAAVEEAKKQAAAELKTKEEAHASDVEAAVEEAKKQVGASQESAAALKASLAKQEKEQAAALLLFCDKQEKEQAAALKAALAKQEKEQAAVLKAALTKQEKEQAAALKAALAKQEKQHQTAGAKSEEQASTLKAALVKQEKESATALKASLAKQETEQAAALKASLAKQEKEQAAALQAAGVESSSAVAQAVESKGKAHKAVLELALAKQEKDYKAALAKHEDAAEEASQLNLGKQQKIEELGVKFRELVDKYKKLQQTAKGLKSKHDEAAAAAKARQSEVQALESAMAEQERKLEAALEAAQAQQAKDRQQQSDSQRSPGRAAEVHKDGRDSVDDGSDGASSTELQFEVELEIDGQLHSLAVSENDDLGALALQFCRDHGVDASEATNIAMELYSARQGAHEGHEADEERGVAEDQQADEGAQSGGDSDQHDHHSVLEFEVALDINDTEYTLVVRKQSAKPCAM
jgi:hypothetical protein